jgi:hypothetical protein
MKGLKWCVISRGYNITMNTKEEKRQKHLKKRNINQTLNCQKNILKKNSWILAWWWSSNQIKNKGNWKGKGTYIYYAIICKNSTFKTIHLDLDVTIHVHENCHINFTKHTIDSILHTREWAWKIHYHGAGGTSDNLTVTD